MGNGTFVALILDRVVSTFSVLRFVTIENNNICTRYYFCVNITAISSFRGYLGDISSRTGEMIEVFTFAVPCIISSGVSGSMLLIIVA